MSRLIVSALVVTGFALLEAPALAQPGEEQAVYCVYKPPTTVGSSEVLPAMQVCVPGP